MIDSNDIEEKADKQRFIEEIDRRNITKLLHFTTNLNVLSILSEGFIIPRNKLESSNDVNLCNSDFQDSLRLDGKNHINCSIERINIKMLNQKKKYLLPEERDLRFFCVIAISPKYIYRKSTMFSVTNAANSYNRNNIGIDGSFEKFISMFKPEMYYLASGYVHHVSRSSMNRDNIPTDIQAEVLIYDSISANDIIQIYVEKEDNILMLKSVMKTSGIEFNPDLFKVDPKIFN